MNFSEGERAFVAQCVGNGCRLDGRGARDFRHVTTQLDVVPQATGSARVRLGKTDVFVGVKVELAEPLPETPDCGRIEFFVDYAPCGTQDIEEEALESYGHELGDALSQLWKLDPQTKKSGGVKMQDLCIVEGRTCFVIYVDAMVLNVDGNVLGAISVGMRAAIHALPIPRVEVSFQDGSDIPEIEIDDEASVELDTSLCAAILTIGSIGEEFVVDMSSLEEAAADDVLHVAVDKEGRVLSAVSALKRPISLETIQAMLSVAKESGRALCARLDSFLKDEMESESSKK